MDIPLYVLVPICVVCISFVPIYLFSLFDYAKGGERHHTVVSTKARGTYKKGELAIRKGEL